MSMTATDTCPNTHRKAKSSYGQILKASAITGGAQGVDMLIRTVRTKLVAILLGPSGVGLVSLYQSIIEMVGTFSGFGINSSGVRQVAEAAGSEDATRVARTARVLSLACWVTGLLGCGLCVAAAVPISKWAFGDSQRASIVAVLGLVLLIDSIAKGQSALLRGTRHIPELAKIQVLSAAGSTLISVGLYSWLGERGILPVLIVSSLSVLLITAWFRKGIKLQRVEVRLPDLLADGRVLVSLGLAFMCGAAAAAAAGFATRALITRQEGLDGNGIYQAAWGLSGLFASFILSAMGLDFYPRLTAAAANHEQVNRLVNEQTEIGVILSLPGLLATLALGPWLIQLFYTSKFAPASQLLPWFVLGVYGQIVSWPIGFIQLAKGASGVFATTQALFYAILVLLTFVLLRSFGLIGVAVAFSAAYAIFVLLTLLIASKLTGFRWSASVRALLAKSALLIICEFLMLQFLNPLLASSIGVALAAITGVVCLRTLSSRLGPDNRIERLAATIPFIGKFLAPGQTRQIHPVVPRQE